MTSSAALISQDIAIQNSRHETSREWEHSRVSHDGKLYRTNDQWKSMQKVPLPLYKHPVKCTASCLPPSPLGLWTHRLGKKVSEVSSSLRDPKSSQKQSLWGATNKAKPGRHSNLILISVSLSLTHTSFRTFLSSANIYSPHLWVALWKLNSLGH